MKKNRSIDSSAAASTSADAAGWRGWTGLQRGLQRGLGRPREPAPPAVLHEQDPGSAFVSSRVAKKRCLAAKNSNFDEQIRHRTHLDLHSSQILIPGNLSQVDCKHPIRSPYPNCNSCPYDEEFSGSNEIARKLSCHNFAKLSEEKVSAGKCTDWVSFPINDPSNHYNFSDFTCVSLIPKDSVNIRLYAEKSTIWERGGE